MLSQDLSKLSEAELVLLVEQQREEIKKLHRRAIDAEYMSWAYKNMLGPIALELVNKWQEMGITRFHASWGPDAFTTLDGEGRAKFLLDVYNQIQDSREEAEDI